MQAHSRKQPEDNNSCPRLDGRNQTTVGQRLAAAIHQVTNILADMWTDTMERVEMEEFVDRVSRLSCEDTEAAAEKAK